MILSLIDKPIDISKIRKISKLNEEGLSNAIDELKMLSLVDIKAGADELYELHDITKYFAYTKLQQNYKIEKSLKERIEKL
jgi:hypothetical protein